MVFDINQQSAMAKQAAMMEEGARLTLEKMRLEMECLKVARESHAEQAAYWRAKRHAEAQERAALP